jgi:hypothetical protein
MNAIAVVLLALALSVSVAQTVAPAWNPNTEAPGPDFKSLFNGRDYSGWNIQPDSGAWSVKDGMIFCNGKHVPPYLIRTEAEYENFEFFGEFKFYKGCNSGIFFHLPIAGAGRESRLGFEAQIMDDGGQPIHKGSTGSIYDVIPPKVNAIRPAGEWNQYHVIFEWPRCRIWLNGVLVQDADFSAHSILKYRLRRGAIGLSNHEAPVHYRNLWVRELPDQDQWTSLFDGKSLAGWQAVGNANWRVEHGKLIADKGEGYLISKERYSRFHFQALLENSKKSTKSKIFYRWLGLQDQGYSQELFDYSLTESLITSYNNQVPETIVPLFPFSVLYYQLINGDREAECRIAGYIVSSQKLLQKVRQGHIVFYRAANDPPLIMDRMRIQPISGVGL